MPVGNFLGPDELALCDEILRRALAHVSEVTPGLIPQQLGAATESARAAIIDNPALQWSPGEPAINSYRTGGARGLREREGCCRQHYRQHAFSLQSGEFLPHEDKQRLTVLVALSDAESGAFSGGGTAFWSAEDRGSPGPPPQAPTAAATADAVARTAFPRAQAVPPTLTVHAPAGTAVVFTGTVTHGAMPVLSGESSQHLSIPCSTLRSTPRRTGERTVFVASFGPKGLAFDEGTGHPLFGRTRPACAWSLGLVLSLAGIVFINAGWI